VKAVAFFSLGFSYTLPKANYDNYACYKKITSSEKYCGLASRGDLVHFRSFKLNVRKVKLSSVQIRGTNHNSPISVTPSEMSGDNSVHGEL
jgi:hypothetical protein